MLPQKLLDRFKSYIDIKDDSQCWEWLGGKVSGYGYFRVGTKKVKAHRLAYEVWNGPLGDSLACHKCDNPGCCNPNHIFAGSHKDNIQDMISKGRNKSSIMFRNGDTCPSSTLKSSDIEQICNLIKSGMNNKEIANLFNVSFQTISKIRNKNRWQHLPCVMNLP